MRSAPLAFLGLLAMVGGVGSFVVVNRTEGAREATRNVVKGREGRIASALSTIEAEIERRFHDRENVNFGYGRMVSEGRYHMGPVAAFVPPVTDREPESLPSAVEWRTKDGIQEFLSEDGVWRPYEGNTRDAFVSETEADAKALATLAAEGEEVVFYTVSRPLAGPLRINGPAFIRERGENAPNVDQAVVKKMADRVVTGRDPGDLDGWSMTAVPLLADGADCVRCHNRMGTKRDPEYTEQGGTDNDKSEGYVEPEWLADRAQKSELRPNETVGWVVVGRRTTAPWTPVRTN